MPVRLLLIADTHVPSEPAISPAAFGMRCHADVVMHAGDWVEPSLLDPLEERSKRLVACWGNNDGAELRAPARTRRRDAGRAAVHRRARDRRVERPRRPDGRGYPDTDVLVFGHSHIPWDTTAETGLRLLNPGSPTDRRRQPFCTYMTATVDDAALSDVVLHKLDRHALTAPPASPMCTRSPRRCHT